MRRTASNQEDLAEGRLSSALDICLWLADFPPPPPLRRLLARIFRLRPWLWERPLRFVAVRIVLLILDRLYPDGLKAAVPATVARNARMTCELVDIKDRVILLHGLSEYPVARLLERIVEDDWVCVDAGANSGEYTLLLSACARYGRVYAFEPAPHIFRKLAANVERNRLTQTVVENLALNSFDGSCTFYVDLSPENTGLSSLSFPAEA